MFVKFKLNNYVFCIVNIFYCILVLTKGISMKCFSLVMSVVLFLYMNPNSAMSQTQEFDNVKANASCSAEVGFMFSAVFVNAHKAFNYCMDRKMREWRAAHS
ncbi:hypothetical protein [Pseudochrobactrum sp. MP213Fo]|uniref:hypothetical protein n=1 Tax=Pseudochrobactrum sp. MP213Fo TaxID=3022250 RepID=UPI003BA06D88